MYDHDEMSGNDLLGSVLLTVDDLLRYAEAGIPDKEREQGGGRGGEGGVTLPLTGEGSRKGSAVLRQGSNLLGIKQKNDENPSTLTLRFESANRKTGAKGRAQPSSRTGANAANGGIAQWFPRDDDVGRGKTALDVMCDAGDAKMIEMVASIEAGAEALVRAANEKNSIDQEYPLTLAARGKHLNVVRALVEHCNTATSGRVNLEVADGRGKTALMLACENGDGDMAELLLQHGAEVVHTLCHENRTVLMYAMSAVSCTTAAQAAAAAAAAAAAKASAKPSDRHVRRLKPPLPLILAALEKADKASPGVIHTCVSAKDKAGWNMLHYAMKVGITPGGREWLKGSAWTDPTLNRASAKTSMGVTPLHLAAWNGRHKALQWLLELEGSRLQRTHTGLNNAEGRHRRVGRDSLTNLEGKFVSNSCNISSVSGSDADTGHGSVGYFELDMALAKAYPHRPSIRKGLSMAEHTHGNHINCAEVLVAHGFRGNAVPELMISYKLMLHRMVLRGQVDAVRALLRCDRSGATVTEDLLHITRNLSGADECTFAFTLYSNPCVQHVHHCPHCCVDVCIVCADRCHGPGVCDKIITAKSKSVRNITLNNGIPASSIVEYEGQFPAFCCRCPKDTCAACNTISRSEILNFAFKPVPVDTSGPAPAAVTPALEKCVAEAFRAFLKPMVGGGVPGAVVDTGLETHTLAFDAMDTLGTVALESPDFTRTMIASTLRAVGVLGYRYMEAPALAGDGGAVSSTVKSLRSIVPTSEQLDREDSLLNLLEGETESGGGGRGIEEIRENIDHLTDLTAQLQKNLHDLWSVEVKKRGCQFGHDYKRSIASPTPSASTSVLGHSNLGKILTTSQVQFIKRSSTREHTRERSRRPSIDGEPGGSSSPSSRARRVSLSEQQNTWTHPFLLPYGRLSRGQHAYYYHIVQMILFNVMKAGYRIRTSGAKLWARAKALVVETRKHTKAVFNKQHILTAIKREILEAYLLTSARRGKKTIVEALMEMEATDGTSKNL